MNLLFAGDLAWPGPDSIDFDALRQLCASARLVANLEGGILDGEAGALAVHNAYKFNLYCHASVRTPLEQLRVIACGLANNHISDYPGALDSSKAALAAQQIAVFGTRAQPWCHLTLGGRDYVLYGACSPLPEPRREAGHDHALPFAPAAALAALGQLRRQFPQATLVAYLHWGYELASYPQPADREWARQAIDAGVDLVIGHHPHVVQGLEVHGRGLIAYSLGNLLLPQTQYRGRRLHYHAAAVCEQLVLEVGGDTPQAHWLHYDVAGARIVRGDSGAAANDARLRARTPFAGMDDAQYRAWFARMGQAGKGGGPVLWSYRGWRRADTAGKFAYLRARAAVRKLAIASGLHRPYNW